MPILGVDVGSTRMHLATVHNGRAMSLAALDGHPYVPSVVGWAHGQPVVGSTARAHVFVAPTEVLFGPARHLGGGPVKLGATNYLPEELVGLLLGEASRAGEIMGRGGIDGVVLSRAAWASPEARRALAAAAQGAGLRVLRIEVSTTLAAVAQLVERGTRGLVAFVDVGGWKLEAAVGALAPGQVRMLGRSVDATIGGNWLDGQLARALAHSVAPENEKRLLKDRLCYALLREQCETARVNLSNLHSVDVSMPFLAPMLGVAGVPVGHLDRPLLEGVSRPLIEAVEAVCSEAAEQAGVQPTQVADVVLVGGLARMPAIRAAVGAMFGRTVQKGGDMEGAVARGAALLAAADRGEPGATQLQVVDAVEDSTNVVGDAGWGQPVPPPSLTPTPELIRAPVASPVTPTPKQELLPPATACATPGARPSTSGSGVPDFVMEDEPTEPTPAPAEVEIPPGLARGPAPAAAPPPAVRIEAAAAPPAVSPAPRPEGAAVHLEAPARSTGAATRAVGIAAVADHHAAAAHAGEAPHTPAPTAAARAPEQTLPAQGTIRNPRTPAELAEVVLGGALQLQQPLPVPVLLLAIGRQRALSGQLKVKKGNTEIGVGIIRGGAAGTPLEMEQLRRSFEWPEGQYSIGGQPPDRPTIKRHPMTGVVVHGLRSCLRAMDLNQVGRVLEPRFKDAPHLMESRAPLVPLLGLSPRELRFVEHVMDGATSVHEILSRGGIGKDTALHLLFILHMFRALEWLSVETRAGESPAERLAARAHKMEKADHFEALGVHWSVARAELEKALRRIEAEMEPGGPANRIAPEAAARIVARARQAFAAVKDDGPRRAYLLELHPDVDFESIESVADNQAQWYAWRGVEEATRETVRLKNELLHLSRLQHRGPKK